MGSSSHTSKIKRGKDAVALDIIAYGFCGIIALVCLVPFIMIVSGSFSSESAIIQNGFSLLPQDFSLEAYKTVFKDPMVVFRAYGTTIGLTIVGTVLGLLLQTMTAYVLSRKEFEWRNQFSFFFYFTTLFSGGLVPYYVLMTQTLNLRDSYLALLLPLLFSVYNLLIMKSYIVGLPDSLIEAAKIDGCGEFRILFRSNRHLLPWASSLHWLIGMTGTMRCCISKTRTSIRCSISCISRLMILRHIKSFLQTTPQALPSAQSHCRPSP